jgi:hypothetical protein
MGYHSVAFMLADYASELEQSPKTTAWILSHPHHFAFVDNPNKLAEEIAIAKGEKPLHPQALKLLKMRHADENQWLVAGGNTIEELKFVRYGKTKDGKKTVTLELPDWWERKYG